MIEIHLDGKPVTKLEAARALAPVGTRHVAIGELDDNGQLDLGGVTVRARHQGLGEVEPPVVHWEGCTTLPAHARTFTQILALAAEIAELAMEIAAEQDAEATPEERLLLAVYGGDPDDASNVRELRRHAAECTKDDHTYCLTHLAAAPELCEYCDAEPATEGRYCEECAAAVALAASVGPMRPCLRSAEHSPTLPDVTVECDTPEHHEPARISPEAVDNAMATQLGWCPATTGPDEELPRGAYCDKQLGEDNKHAGNHHAHVGDGSEVAWGDEDDPWIRKGTRFAADEATQ